VYEVKNDELWLEGKKLGTTDTIYVDGRQDIAGHIKQSRRKKISVARLPEGDYVMVTPSGLTVGIEEKKSDDLEASLRNRRLQRQLRGLEEVVNIPLLGLRFDYEDTFCPPWWQLGRTNLSVEILKWSLRGGIVLLPSDPDRLLMTLWRIRNILQPGQHLFSIVAGTDKKPKGRSPFHRAVQRMVEGVGPATARKLNVHYAGSLKKFLLDTDEGWKKAGMNTAQRRALGGLLNEDKCNSTG